MEVTTRKFKKQHSGLRAILAGILLGRFGINAVDENGFEVDEFGNPIDYNF